MAVLAMISALFVVGRAGAQELSAQYSSWDHSAHVAQSSFPTPAAIAIPDSVRVQVGYQHWRGAGIGAGIGGVLGALAGAIAANNTSCSDCGHQPSEGIVALLGGLLGAGVGGVVGFLAGLATPKYAWTSETLAPR